jgi:hypothetical protein
MLLLLLLNEKLPDTYVHLAHDSVYVIHGVATKRVVLTSVRGKGERERERERERELKVKWKTRERKREI